MSKYYEMSINKIPISNIAHEFEFTIVAPIEIMRILERRR